MYSYMHILHFIHNSALKSALCSSVTIYLIPNKVNSVNIYGTLILIILYQSGFKWLKSDSCNAMILAVMSK